MSPGWPRDAERHCHATDVSGVLYTSVLYFVVVQNDVGWRMQVSVHPRVTARHPEVTEEDVVAAFTASLRSRPRNTDPLQWVGVGMDAKSRLLEYVAIEIGMGEWLVFHAMLATAKVLIEVGLKGGDQGG